MEITWVINQLAPNAVQVVTLQFFQKMINCETLNIRYGIIFT